MLRVSEITAKFLFAFASIRAHLSLVMYSFVLLDDSFAFTGVFCFEQDIISEFSSDL